MYGILRTTILLCLIFGSRSLLGFSGTHPDTCGYYGPPHAEPGNSFCSNEEFNPIVALPTTGGILHWYLDSSLTELLGTGSYLYPLNIVGTTTYYVVGINGDCISEYSEVNVEVYDSPMVEIYPEMPCLSDALGYVELFADAHGSFEWKPFSTEQTFQAEDTGFVFLNVINSMGCVGSDSVYVEGICQNSILTEGCDFYVPNVFTPNNDGLNEVLEVFPSSEVENYLLELFNRNGEVIFTSEDGNNFFQGGDKYFIADGIYFYRIEYMKRGLNKKITGTVLVIR